MAHRLGQHAVVIGGSLAGLMTARVLSDHFDAVTVLERDDLDVEVAAFRDRSLAEQAFPYVFLDATY